MLQSFYDILAYIGTLVLVVRGFPQAYRSWSRGNSFGLSIHMLWLWFIGSTLFLPYSISNVDIPVTTVYLTNILFVGIMLWYKYFPRKVDADNKREEKDS